MSEHVLFDTRGQLGVITLNRPQAMNALTTDMVRQMLHRLTQWKEDDAVAQVLIRGAGEKGLCAGGDIRAIYEDIRATHERGDDAYATAEFLALEFQLNLLIHQYPKPYVALMDGVTLGGGIGISAHGSHRVVTERTKAGMPEATIGYLTDVGGTYLLSRSPGQTGPHAGLTAGVFGAADSIHLNLADVYTSSHRLDELTRALEHSPADEVLSTFAEKPAEAPLQEHREWIDDAYSADSVEEILEQLESWGARYEAAENARQAILAKSPTAVKLILHGIHQAREADLPAALQGEYAAALYQLRGSDFAEGIRAQVIDKDRAPHWKPDALSEISEISVANAFLPDAGSVLTLSDSSQEATA